MTELHNHEFTDVIKKLELLQSVKPDSEFKTLMQKKVRSYATPHRFAMPFFALRVAMIVFVILASGTTMIAAAQQSKPGDILYPLKQATHSLRTNFGTETEISKVPTPLPKQPTQATNLEPTNAQPTPTFPVKKQPLTPTASETNPIPTPTPTPSTGSGPTATPTPAPQGVLPALDTTVDTVLDTLPVKINLPIGGSSQPTPTPQSKTEGSKDNGTSAGAGGFLLPKINIKL